MASSFSMVRGVIRFSRVFCVVVTYDSAGLESRDPLLLVFGVRVTPPHCVFDLDICLPVPLVTACFNNTQNTPLAWRVNVRLR